MQPLGRTRWAIAEGYLPRDALPIVVQHSRLDARDAVSALITTIAYAEWVE